jgi:HAD superfamily hydrolase (TIGR01490 family)
MRIGAFFDIDGTIVNANSQFELAKGLCRARYLRFTDLAKMTWWSLMYDKGVIRDSVAIRKRIYSSLPSLQSYKFDEIVKTIYSDAIRPKICSGFFQVIKDHKARGHLTVAVSGTISNIAELICRDLGIEQVYATNLTVLDGRYTWAWDGEILEGNNKAIFIQDFAKKYNLDLKQSYFYTDHSSDLPSLASVGFPVVVNGSRQLNRIALRKQWQVLKP